MAVVPPDGFVPLGGRALGGPVLVDVVAVGGVPLGVVPPTPVDDAPAPVKAAADHIRAAFEFFRETGRFEAVGPK